MDVTRQAFVRHLALDRWREIEDMQETLGLDRERAAQEAGGFLTRGSYASLWVRHWRETVLPAAGQGDPANLFAAIERAMAAALMEEEAMRKSREDRALEEEPEYKAFVDRALEHLLRQQAGELDQPS